MSKFRTIDLFFKKNEDGNSEDSTLLGSNVEASTSNDRPSKSSRIVHYYFTFHTKKKKLYMAPPNINFWLHHWLWVP